MPINNEYDIGMDIYRFLLFILVRKGATQSQRINESDSNLLNLRKNFMLKQIYSHIFNMYLLTMLDEG